MSEYQFVAFLAVDKPVSDKDLEFMRKQSSRAEVTPWTFENEYHFGDFHGNAQEMLRRGYDVHLHYANFGVRKLMIRLPYGLPDVEAARPYLDDESLQLVQDKKGPGAILAIEPYYEAGELDELWDLDETLAELAPLRAELMDGDLRPLYIANLAIGHDTNHDPDETTEGPVPAGLSALTPAQSALVNFYGLGSATLEAAAEQSPALPSRDDVGDGYEAWLRRQSESKRIEWLATLMREPASSVRRDLLAEFRKSTAISAWPTVTVGRTLSELDAMAEKIAAEAERRAKKKAEQQRTMRLIQIAKNPEKTIQETEKLVEVRGRDSYCKIAELLSDLRDALSASGRSDMAEQQARKLKIKHPTLGVLAAELRRAGFLGK